MGVLRTSSDRLKPVLHMPRAIFVGGTASHAGKSWMCTAICRYLRKRGVCVAPFKAQNMSNNSYPCASGGEIGRAQVVQAEACGLEPETDMNPILLKPTSNAGSQVVVDGKVWKNLGAAGYYDHHAFLRQRALEAYERLAARFDYIVIEGAGSVAEVNLKQRDLVNLAMARAAGAPALLVADIDRGGVFASILGTLCLLDPEERAQVRSFAVNRFRGDPRLFEDGVRFLEERSSLPCLGVFPMAEEIAIQPEDGVSLDDTSSDPEARIAVVRLPRISNFTDFRHLRLTWISSPVAREFDWIILPGTKNTMGDLDWLRARGLDAWIQDQHRRGARVLGVCGGYQMLGESIDDPYAVESARPSSSAGLGLLPVRSRLEREKVTRVVQARAHGIDFGAYEIHMGQTVSAAPPFATLEDGSNDGAVCGDILGTYLHGALEHRPLARELFGEEALLPPAGEPYDQLASWFAESANVRLFEELYL
jgi:adenosylcobyric acid synthase